MENKRIFSDRITRRNPVLAWVEETKGIFDLINAYEILQIRKTNFNLTIAGDGTALERAKSVVVEKSLTNKVNFVGWVHDQEKMST